MTDSIASAVAPLLHAVRDVSLEIADGEFVHRTELADFLCDQFDFHDARGQAQRYGCLKALRGRRFWSIAILLPC